MPYANKNTKFKTQAKLWQSKWREEHGYPLGIWRGHPSGSLLEKAFAIRERVNFITPEIGELVVRAISNKEKGAMISEPRIWNNLLASQALCFNLFGVFSLDLEAATEFLVPFFGLGDAKITSIVFEHSPGRQDLHYLGDGTAFDAFIEYIYENGKRGFIAIEVKYVEDMSVQPTSKPRYEELARQFSFFNDDNIREFQRNGRLNQVWRDHLLALSLLLNKDYDEGEYIFLYPAANIKCDSTIKKYLALLEKDVDCFCIPTHIESFINELLRVVQAEWVWKLQRRYLGFLENRE